MEVLDNREIYCMMNLRMANPQISESEVLCQPKPPVLPTAAVRSAKEPMEDGKQE